MNKLYNIISATLKEDVITSPSIIPEEDINVDQLIQKPSLYCYINKSFENDLNTSGIHTKMVTCYLCRIPKTIPQYKKFLSNHIGVRISLNKLLKSKSGYKLIGRNIPGLPDGSSIVDPQLVMKLNDQKEELYKFFENNNIVSMPKIEIHTLKGIIPEFTYKILKDI